MSRAGRPVTHRYGADPQQVAELWLPAAGAAGARGVVVLLHGGFWRAGYDRSLQHPVADDLCRRGWAVWNVDYRGVGAGGGWPATFTDVAAGVDALAPVGRGLGLGLDRVVVLGHSAGGTLALWAAARRRLPAGAPGADPVLVPAAAGSQAGVTDLVAAARGRLGDGAAVDLLGATPEQRPERYALASPLQAVPLGVPLLVVATPQDAEVPAICSERFAAAALAAGDDVRLELVDGEDHYAHLDPGSRCWQLTAGWLESAAATAGTPGGTGASAAQRR